MEQNLKELAQRWQKEESERLKQGKRKYLHFDLRISHLTNKIISDILSPGHIARHSFYPLIQREKSLRKRKKNIDTGKKIIAKKVRPISYASHYDALIYSWYGYLLSALYEKKLTELEISENVIGYRKLNKNNVNFAGEIIDYIKSKRECGIICIDLEKFFENIDHRLLKKVWKNLLSVDVLPIDHYAVYKNITKYTFINFKDLFKHLSIKKLDINSLKRFCDPSIFRKLRKDHKDLIIANENKGIPQGSTMSAIVANFYMLEFDTALSQYLKKIDGVYRRYSDDVIIICPITSLEEVEKKIDHEINFTHLSINKSKTERLIYKVPNIFDYETKRKTKLQYLGIEFDGERTFLRHSGIANFQRKMTRTIKKLANRSEKKKKAFPKKKILSRFFFSKKSNYLSYAKRAGNILNSTAIKKQIAPHKIIKRVKKLIKKYTHKQDI